MSIGNFNQENKTIELKSKYKSIIKNEIKIQCPNCGSIFILNESREYFCRNCDKIYSESEIRERCGL